NKQVGPLSPAPTFAGFGNRDIEGEQWRFFQLHATADEYVVVAEKHSIRQEMIDEIALSTALPQLILIPALMALLIFLIDKNFRPISELRSAIAQRSAHKLDRIYVANQTLELSPLVDTLNELLEQLEQAWQREKRFTRMAAHELKTPLTILRLNAENAINSETRHQLEQDLDNILKGIDRTDRMLHQLLTLAKVESITNVHKQPCELKTLLQSVVADLAPLALRHHQTLSLEGDNVTIDGDEVLLGILFRNLVDNAIRYSGDHSVIDVVIKQHADGIDVTVSDNGANLSDETRDKLFDNFYRANTEKGDGAGLGMSITRDIAQLHNASITLLPRTQDKNTFRIRFSQA
ncbi:two-component sensor histidine kinase, partial [Vibrio sp. V37_P2S8PM304]